MFAPVAAVAAAASLLAAAPAGLRAAEPSCHAQAQGLDSFCEIEGARLHFVDWGGQGQPLILLGGFGDSARIFDELAPLLARDHRVYAFTRRGFGRSQGAAADYRAERLAADVVELMDALGIRTADLVGHSAAGGEMVLVAQRHPERVRRLVYLDAAYDRSEALALEAGEPTPRRPPPSALLSYEAFAAWRASALGSSSPAIEANARQTLRLEDGALKPATPPSRMAAIATAGLLTVPPSYSAIAAPSLAIYASKLHPEQLPPEATAEQRAASRAYALRRIRPWMLREQARFLESAPCGVAIEPDWATHYLFLQRPAWTADTIRSFLSDPNPCRWQASG